MKPRSKAKPSFASCRFPNPLLLGFGLVLIAVTPLVAADDGRDPDSPYHVRVGGQPATVYRAHTWDPGGVEAFLANSLHYVPEDSTETGTDLVVAPMSLGGRPE